MKRNRTGAVICLSAVLALCPILSSCGDEAVDTSAEVSETSASAQSSSETQTSAETEQTEAKTEQNETETQTSAAESVAETETEAHPEETSETAETQQARTVASVAEEKKGSGLKKVESEGKLAENSHQAVRRSGNKINQSVGTTFTGDKLPSDFYLYRNQLSGNQLKAYDIICSGFIGCNKSIKITVPINEEELSKIFEYIIYDRPELFWLDLKYDYYYNEYGNITDLEMNYNSLADDIEGNTLAMEKSVYPALKAMSELPNDIEKVKYAHDYLTHTVDYVHNDLDQVAYSALVNHETVCAGYSQAFTYMMHKMGIPCAVAVGYAGEAHAWCKVIIDGECYAMDVTWDDPVDNPPDKYYYDYFNVTDKQLSADHVVDPISEGLPAAKSTKASFKNYFGSDDYGTNFDGSSVRDDGSSEADEYFDDDEYDYDDYDYDDDYDDSSWYDDEFGYYDDDEYEDSESGWWNYLDSSWEESDWEYDEEEEIWYFYDEESECLYLYMEEDDLFGCMDPEDETLYIYDPDEDEWIEIE